MLILRSCIGLFMILDSLLPRTPASSEDGASSPLSWRCSPDPKIGAVAAAQSVSLQRIYLWRSRWLSTIDPPGNFSPFARLCTLRRRHRTNAFGIGIQLFKDPGIVVAVAGTSFPVDPLIVPHTAGHVRQIQPRLSPQVGLDRPRKGILVDEHFFVFFERLHGLSPKPVNGALLNRGGYAM